MKKKLLFGLQILLSIALLGWVITLVPVDAWRNLPAVPLHHIALAMTCMVGFLALGALRLYRLLKGFVPGANFFLIFKGTWLGYFCSSFLPSSVGGDAVKLVWLSKRLGNSAAILAGMVVERVLNLSITIVIASVFLVQSASRLEYTFSTRPNTLWLLMLGIIGLTLCGAAGLFIARSQHRLAVRLRDYARQIREALQYWKQHPWCLFEAIFWSGSALILTGVGVLLPAVWAVGADISALQAIGCISTVTLLALIPLAVNGIGVYEAGLVGLLVMANCSPEASAQVAILVRIIIIFAALPGAGWLFSIRATKPD
jgi:hypothetical protein